MIAHRHAMALQPIRSRSAEMASKTFAGFLMVGLSGATTGNTVRERTFATSHAQSYNFNCGEKFGDEKSSLLVQWSGSSSEITNVQIRVKGKVDQSALTARIRAQIVLSNGSPGFYALCVDRALRDPNRLRLDLVLRSRGGPQPWEEVISL